jgi:hypothetical protein
MREGAAWKAAYRLVRVGIRLVAMLAALVLIAAAMYEQIGAWRDSRVLKQIGRSVDIGGRTLNIHCTGEGSPTVVFVSGRASPGYVWTPTQRGVSAFTRACWYDRADVGWSDSGPDPAWGDAAARICIASCRTQDSSRFSFSSAPHSAGTSSACITMRTLVRSPGWCSRMPRTRTLARFKACRIVIRRRFRAL